MNISQMTLFERERMYFANGDVLSARLIRDTYDDAEDELFNEHLPNSREEGYVQGVIDSTPAKLKANTQELTSELEELKRVYKIALERLNENLACVKGDDCKNAKGRAGFVRNLSQVLRYLPRAI